MICDAVTGAHNSIAFNNSTSLALSQHTGLCCVILPIRAGVSAVSESVCVCESVCGCMHACTVQSSPLIAGSPDTDGARQYHIPEALFREGQFQEIIDRHREDPSPPHHTHTHTSRPPSLCFFMSAILIWCCTHTNTHMKMETLSFFFDLLLFFLSHSDLSPLSLSHHPHMLSFGFTLAAAQPGL